MTATFFGGTYDEAMTLLVEARDWVRHCEPDERRRLSTMLRLRQCRETMRMTARLTQVMAWLLAQKAIHAGEMTQREQIERQEPLGSVAICMEHPAALDGLPRRLVSLLERSHRLYLRVARLDDGLRRRL